MSRAVLILAAHGAGDRSPQNELVRAWAKQLAVEGHFDTVAPAFQLGAPRYADVLDTLPRVGERAIVVPVMTGAGYFCRVVLPREMARNRRTAETRIEWTEPVGTQPEMIDIVERQVREAAARHVLPLHGTTVVLVGHGTRRHAQSRGTTEVLCAAVRARSVACDVRAAFLDDEPSIEETLHRLADGPLIVVPFLLGGGGHATQDIPRRLNLGGATDEPPAAGEWNGRVVVLTAPLGENPKLLAVVRRLALEQLHGHARAIASPMEIRSDRHA